VFERRGDIYTMSSTGKNVFRITKSGRNYQPTWSRTDKQIAYVHVHPNGIGDIYRISVSGGTSLQLTTRSSCLGSVTLIRRWNCYRDGTLRGGSD